MNLKKLINEKKGSYIVDASITLPVMIICVCCLILIIRIISLCENITFITSKYLVDEILGFHSIINKNSLCNEIERTSETIKDFEILQYKYLYNDGNQRDLIRIVTKTEFTVPNPLGIDANISFDQQVLCRGFTGQRQDTSPLSESEFISNGNKDVVYVFPRYGERYHIKTCRYVKQYEEDAYILSMYMEDAKRKDYSPCKVCLGAANE